MIKDFFGGLAIVMLMAVCIFAGAVVLTNLGLM